MNRFARFAALTTLSAVFLSTGAVYAQDRDDHHDEHRDADHRDDRGYVRHEEWKKGYHMRHEDWDRGRPVDYRAYHLQEPPRGYEWREVDGNYVLAAVATGIIASAIVASAAH
jgi:Ni/Co efflux regulator RcnB